MKILLIDDDDFSRRAIQNFITDALSYEVDAFDNCSEAFGLYQKVRHPLIISDIRMPGMNGMDLLKAVKALDREEMTEVVLITGFGELETSIEALRLGAYDYLLKPVNISELGFVIKKVTEKKILKEENKKLTQHFQEELNRSTSLIQKKLEQMEMVYSELFDSRKIGIFSSQMQEITQLANIFHQHRDICVLIQGETGTGKEIIARLIHQSSQKSNKPFISVNCSAISPTLFESELFGYEKGSFTGASQFGQIGKIEMAQGGTIFFDEIGDMPVEMQPKLLRVIQEKELYRIGGKEPIKLDVRFLFATHANLDEMTKNGRFRSDLLFRINTGKIYIPPLRDRKTDIAPLALMFLKEISESRNKSFKDLSKSAVSQLEKYEWKGNVRELRSVIERAVLLNNSEVLDTQHLDIFQNEQTFLSPNSNEINLPLPHIIYPLEDIEYDICRKILDKFNGNISQSARYLGISWKRFKRLAKM